MAVCMYRFVCLHDTYDNLCRVQMSGKHKGQRHRNK